MDYISTMQNQYMDTIEEIKSIVKEEKVLDSVLQEKERYLERLKRDIELLEKVIATRKEDDHPGSYKTSALIATETVCDSLKREVTTTREVIIFIKKAIKVHRGEENELI